MLGRRGEFEGLADWLPMLPLWVVPFSTLAIHHQSMSDHYNHHHKH